MNHPLVRIALAIGGAVLLFTTLGTIGLVIGGAALAAMAVMALQKIAAGPPTPPVDPRLAREAERERAAAAEREHRQSLAPWQRGEGWGKD